MKVGFIGLGSMGAPMSRNVLAAGHDLLVHDLRREAAAGLEGAGAGWAATPRDTAAGREAVITMLPAPRHVEQVLLGPDGLLSGLAPGSVWIDMSTSVPAVADRVRAVAGDIAVLDAPVSGMAVGAKAGTLQIFVGGEEPVFHRVRPMLEAMGDPERILHVGGHGAGYTVKLMINLLWFAHLVATAEVLTIGTQAGVDLATLRRCLLASPAASNFLERDVLSVLERRRLRRLVRARPGLQGPRPCRRPGRPRRGAGGGERRGGAGLPPRPRPVRRRRRRDAPDQALRRPHPHPSPPPARIPSGP